MARIYKTEAGGRRLIEAYRTMLAAWPVPCEQLTLKTSQGETFVVVSGDKSAPPLLLLHGAGANSLVWFRDIAAWSAHFRVFAVDTIGEPGLSAPSRPPLRSNKYARWLCEVMDGLSLTRASVVGVSLGGWMALDFATRCPERVSRLALLCPGGVGRQRLSFLLKASWLLLLGERGRRKTLVLALGPAAKEMTPQALAYVLAVSKEFKPRASKLPVFRDNVLRRLVMPVLLIVGERDAMLDSAETISRLKRTAPKLEARALPEAGHLILGQTETILAFLRAAPT